MIWPTHSSLLCGHSYDTFVWVVWHFAVGKQRKREHAPKAAAGAGKQSTEKAEKRKAVGKVIAKKKEKKSDAVPTFPEGMGNFKDNPVLEHYLGVVIPVREGDAEGAKAALSDFNRQYFASSDLKVTSNLLDRENQLILVKQFVRKDRAMDYYRVLTNNRESMIDFNTSGYKVFVIHTENYVELFKGKDVDGYLMFFDQYYLRD